MNLLGFTMVLVGFTMVLLAFTQWFQWGLPLFYRWDLPWFCHGLPGFTMVLHGYNMPVWLMWFSFYLHKQIGGIARKKTIPKVRVRNTMVLLRFDLPWFCLVLPWFVGFCHGFTQICNGLILFLLRCPTVLLGFTMVLLEFTMVLQWFCHLGFSIVLLSFCIYHGVALFYGDLPCLCLALRSIGIYHTWLIRVGFPPTSYSLFLLIFFSFQFQKPPGLTR